MLTKFQWKSRKENKPGRNRSRRENVIEMDLQGIESGEVD
jgi:hypothetical protein